MLLYYRVIFICFSFARINKADLPGPVIAATTSVAAAAGEVNVLKDSLTGMFNYARQPNSKTCGYNFQKLNISLESLWASKFQLQVKNTLVLTSLFSSYLNERKQSDLIDSTSSNGLEVNFQSLCSFMLTQLSRSSFSSSSLGQSDTAAKPAKPTSKQILVDSFIASIGYVLIDKQQTSCFNTLVNQTKSELKSVTVDRSCATMGLPATNKDASTQPKDETKFNKFKGPELNENLDDSLTNCVNWLDNLKKSYETNPNVAKPTAHDYASWMQLFLVNQTFVSSLWCGPYYECDESSPKQKQSDWTLKYTLPLVDARKRFVGAVSVKFRLGQLDLNQCANGDPIVSNTHKCKLNSECAYTPAGKFQLGSYKCKCTNGFMNNGSFLVYNGVDLETQYWYMKNNKNNTYQENFDCMPCTGKQCCSSEFISNTYYSKIDNHILKDYENRMNLFWPCRSYNMTLRILILSVQIVSILFVIWLSLFIFYKRQNKVIRHSMWVLCEILLFGAFLLYFTVIIQYFEPNMASCISLPWFRELGFTVIYGILNLRLYKILIEFQSRKAHCVQLKDKDILRILFFMVVCVFGYLTAWTLVDLDYANEGYSVVTNTSLKGFIQYPICKIKWWDYFIEIDTILILFFIRCHATVTVMLLLIFITKVCFLFKQSSDDPCLGPRLSKIDVNEIATMDPLKYQNRKGKTNGNYDVEEFNLMEPSEIRSELKRLYTEIHMYKTKSLKHENPHIQTGAKRNKLKKMRKFSNAFLNKNNVKDKDNESAKTPEESVCSNDFPNNNPLTPNV